MKSPLPVLAGWCLLLTINSTPVAAQSLPSDRSWTYQVLPGSVFLEDCPICDRPSRPLPLHGSFRLRLLEETPLAVRYAIQDVDFTAVESELRTYRVRGAGTLEIGGEVALRQQLHLDLQVDNGLQDEPIQMTHASFDVPRLWPMLDVSVDEITDSQIRVYRLQILAAPFVELWFTTTGGLTPGLPSFEGRHLGPGDLLAQTGRIVKTQDALFARLDVAPDATTAHAIDALDIAPGGEVWFSCREDLSSRTLGPIHHGDIVSDQGRIVRRNEALLAPFGIMPPVPDLGLDALQIQPDGRTLFSLRTDTFSENLGVLLRRGDILSDQGLVFRRTDQLLARFHPAKPGEDVGLDALHVWPSDEIWFSTETGFTDDQLGILGPGDLLSDQGYVVFKNLELVSAFQPLEDLADFGLDALFLVTDTAVRTSPPTLAPPVFAQGAVELTWKGPGQVFQLEKADRASGPYTTLGSISPDSTFRDSDPLTGSNGFYRVRQW